MARKYKKLEDQLPQDPKKPADPMKEMRARFERSVGADRQLRLDALSDYKFCWVPGNQWDPWLYKKRVNRPTYEFNRTRQLTKQVTNDQRQNRPAVKFRARNPEKVKLNEAMDGMYRADWDNSDGDTAVDTAFRWAVTGGLGVFRANTRYSDENAFDQEIYWEEVDNPLSVYWGPSKKYTREDAPYAFVIDTIPRDEFKQRWPEAELVDFNQGGLGDETMLDWFGQEHIRIAEYWYKKEETVDLLLLSDGRTVEQAQVLQIMDELAQSGITVAQKRTVKRMAVWHCLVSGSEELEKPTRWAGKYIPLVPVWGELSRVDGKDYYTGMVRYLRDPQALYNFHRSIRAEMLAKAPKAPFIATPAQIKGFESMWRNLGETDYSVLMANPDQNGQMPQRSAPPDVPSSLIQAGMQDVEDMKGAAGIFDASLGARSNETSGKAILARQREGDIANFDFIDNLARSIKYAGKIYADLAPKIYDTTRTRRTLGIDGAEDFIQLNQPVLDEQTGQTIYLNDLSQTQFDVAVSVGPSYTTQRMEAVDMLTNLAQNPQIAPLVADLIAKNADIPEAEELERRMRKIGIQQGFIDPGPEDGQPPQPPPPNPKDVAQAENYQSQAMLNKAKTAQIMATTPVETEKMQAETQRTQADALRAATQAGQAAGQWEPILPGSFGPYQGGVQ